MPDVLTPEATPQDGSLESASQRLVGLLSDVPEDKQPASDAAGADSAPATESKLADAAPEKAEGSEQPESKDAKTAEEPAPEKPQTFKARVNGQEVEVTLEEALKGYSRTEDYTRKTQELAEARKKFETEEIAAVRAERDQYKTYLGELKKALEDLTPKEPDWDKVKNELSPEAFAAEVLSWQQRQKHIDKITEEQKRVQSQQDEEARKGFEEIVRSERTKLEAALPDMKDPEKAKAINKDLVEYATVELGFTPEQLGQVTDHRLVLLLHKAMRHDRAEKNAPKIQNKIERALDSSPPGGKQNAPKANVLDAAKTRLEKSGRVEDAAKALEHLI